MPDYQNSKIYVIKSPNIDKVYIGSTTQKYLCKRWAQHKDKSNPTSSKIIIEAGDAYIELIEEFPCNSIEELNKREGEIIRATTNYINKNIAGRTVKEYQEGYQKEYYQNNKQQKKEYYQNNKQKIAEKYRLSKKSIQQSVPVEV